jgi:hypothetical protein
MCSNPAWGMFVSAFLCVVLSCVGRGLAMVLFSTEAVLQDVQTFIILELILSRNNPENLIRKM